MNFIAAENLFSLQSLGGIVQPCYTALDSIISRILVFGFIITLPSTWTHNFRNAASVFSAS